MLKIIYGNFKSDNFLFDAETYFRNQYDVSWFNDPFVKEIVKDIDNSIVLDNGIIDSPVFGLISPDRISGGAKTLILAYKLDGFVFNGTACGENCAKWFLEIGKLKDITINLKYLMDFGDEPFEVFVLNDNKVYSDRKTLLLSMINVEGV